MRVVWMRVSRRGWRRLSTCWRPGIAHVTAPRPRSPLRADDHTSEPRARLLKRLRIAFSGVFKNSTYPTRRARRHRIARRRQGSGVGPPIPGLGAVSRIYLRDYGCSTWRVAVVGGATAGLLCSVGTPHEPRTANNTRPISTAARRVARIVFPQFLLLPSEYSFVGTT
jgi:hypothetical protein